VQNYYVFQSAAAGLLRNVMIYSFANSTLTPTGLPWQFMGGSSTPARDGLTYLDGDTLIPLLDGSLVVLSFALGAIGCWVTLIMVEQLIYNATKRLSWLHWAIACGIAHGIAICTSHITPYSLEMLIVLIPNCAQ
jgi:hypothetical protein